MDDPDPGDTARLRSELLDDCWTLSTETKFPSAVIELPGAEGSSGVVVTPGADADERAVAVAGGTENPAGVLYPTELLGREGVTACRVAGDCIVLAKMTG